MSLKKNEIHLFFLRYKVRKQIKRKDFMAVPNISFTKAYLHIYDKKKPLFDKLDASELLSAGFTSEQVSGVLGINGKISIDELSSRIDTDTSKLYNSLKSVLISKQKLNLTQYKKIGVKTESKVLSSYVVATKHVEKSKKTVIVYGDNHISASTQEVIIKDVSSFVKNDGMKYLGVERRRKEKTYPVSCRKKTIDKISDDMEIMRENNYQILAGEILELIFGKSLATYGLKDPDIDFDNSIYRAINTPYDINPETKKVIDNLFDTSASQLSGLIFGADHLAYIYDYLKTKNVSFVIMIPKTLNDYSEEDAKIYYKYKNYLNKNIENRNKILKRLCDPNKRITPEFLLQFLK
jgi:hypothetical protein